MKHLLIITLLLIVVLVVSGCSEYSSTAFKADRKYDGPCVIEVNHAYSGEVVDERETFTYNEMGQLVIWEHDNDYTSGDFADGILEQRITYTYYEDGKLATEENDHVYGSTEPKTVDGIIDNRTVYFYDSEGKLERTEYDTGEGTDPTNLRYYTYNAADLLVLIEIDGNTPDGTIDGWMIFEYDSAGHLLVHDQASDSIEETYFRTLYTYDSNGNNTIEETDDEADGSIDYRVSYTYDSGGNITVWEIDGQGCMGFTPPDDIVDMRYQFTYDATGNLITMTVDGDPHDANGADGQLESLTTYIYDDFGNLLSEELDREIDGEMNSVTTYTYDCWADIPLE